MWTHLVTRALPRMLSAGSASSTRFQALINDQSHLFGALTVSEALRLPQLFRAQSHGPSSKQGVCPPKHSGPRLLPPHCALLRCGHTFSSFLCIYTGSGCVYPTQTSKPSPSRKEPHVVMKSAKHTGHMAPRSATQLRNQHLQNHSSQRPLRETAGPGDRRGTNSRNGRWQALRSSTARGAVTRL